MHKQLIGILVVGPAGAGKDTLVTTIIEENLGLPVVFKRGISAKTRPPRNGEVHGHNAFFCDIETFERMFADGEILERNPYAGHLYGKLRKPFEDVAASSGEVICTDIDYHGADALLERFPGQIAIIYLEVDEATAQAMMVQRAAEQRETLDEADVAERLSYVATETAWARALVARLPERVVIIPRQTARVVAATAKIHIAKWLS